jgi:regulator of sigma E protease
LDPLTLDERLRGRAGEKISVTVSRKNENGKDESLVKEITLRDPAWYEESFASGSPASAPTLGIAYRVLSVVHRIEADSPARKATLMENGKEATVSKFEPQDMVVKAEVIPGNAAEKKLFDERKLKPFEFSDEKPNWPYFEYFLQSVSPEAKVILTLRDGRTVELQPVDSKDSFLADRGLETIGLLVTTKADSWSQAMALGGRETKEGLLQVYSFLRRIGTQISVKGMAGPLQIFTMAGSSAQLGPSTLLIFLTMLSTNLAVINFLPIPVLDGGHMVFLAYEGIFRRPVNERLRETVTFAGLMFILCLMGFVILLDTGVISRGGG